MYYMISCAGSGRCKRQNVRHKRRGLRIPVQFIMSDEATSYLLCSYFSCHLCVFSVSMFPACAGLLLPFDRAFLVGAGTSPKPKSTHWNLTLTTSFLTSVNRGHSRARQHGGGTLRTRSTHSPQLAGSDEASQASGTQEVGLSGSTVQAAGTQIEQSIQCTTAKIPPLPVEDASDEKDQSLKSRSSSHSPHKEGRKVPTKQSDMHPLAVEFRGTCLSTIACKFK
jgi:hypothetical protein